MAAAALEDPSTPAGEGGNFAKVHLAASGDSPCDRYACSIVRIDSRGLPGA
jgi:hypothetical protein